MYYPVKPLPTYPDHSFYTLGLWNQDRPINVETSTENIGWLNGHDSFVSGVPESALTERLVRYCRRPLLRLWSLPYPCPRCQQQRYPIVVDWNTERLQLGTAEIRVLHPDGKIFACPDLIYHFVADHHYAPPTVFINAVIWGLDPDSPTYLSMIQRIEQSQMSALRDYYWQREHGDTPRPY